MKRSVLTAEEEKWLSLFLYEGWMHAPRWPLEGTWPAACSPGLHRPLRPPCQPPHLAGASSQPRETDCRENSNRPVSCTIQQARIRDRCLASQACGATSTVCSRKNAGEQMLLYLVSLPACRSTTLGMHRRQVT
ncbi:unnamed protein product [Lota lota]